jgi:hypothetical protein
MLDIVVSLVPIFALILLGQFLRLWRPLDARFWAAADRLTYYVFFPILLFVSIAKADLADMPVSAGIGLPVVTLLLVTGGLLFLRPRLRFKGPAFASVMQGSIRTNTYIALAAALAVYGEEALPAVALGIIAFVPFVNLVSVLVHVRYGSGKSGRARSALFEIATNPLILACIAGIACNLADVVLPELVDTTLELLGRAALPMGLLSVGAALEFASVKRSAKALVVASAIKLAVLPAILLVAMSNADLGGVPAGVLLLFAAAPTSVSSFVLARHMGGDYKLMASLITVQVLCGMATLPVWLWLASFVV